MPNSDATIIKSFNNDFCDYLEYHLCRAFQNSSIKEFKCFWCDGVKKPFVNTQLIKTSIVETEKIETEAWMGEDGQQIYQMNIYFGPDALKRSLNGSSLIPCIPGYDPTDWITVDFDNRVVELQLL